MTLLDDTARLLQVYRLFNEMHGTAEREGITTSEAVGGVLNPVSASSRGVHEYGSANVAERDASRAVAVVARTPSGSHLNNPTNGSQAELARPR
jgi:hypothetical protein